MTKHLKIILTEMCKRVGADFDSIDFKKENWFHDYEWTKEEEDRFIEWLLEYSKNNNLHPEVSRWRLRNKHLRTKFAQQFVMNHGWKTKI